MTVTTITHLYLYLYLCVLCFIIKTRQLYNLKLKHISIKELSCLCNIYQVFKFAIEFCFNPTKAKGILVNHHFEKWPIFKTLFGYKLN